MSPELKPDIAIADPELAASMPPSVTANTGFDAIECYVLTPPSDMVDPLCIWAAETIWKWLPEAVANGGNMLARDKMHLAALQAGMAFGNGRLGSVHLLSHEISAQLEPLAESYSDYIIKKRLAALTPEQCRADGWPVSDEEVKTLYSHAWNGTLVDLE